MASSTPQSRPPAPDPQARGGDDEEERHQVSPEGPDDRATRRPRVLLGVSGSVAAIKAPLVCEHLLRFADVRVVLTSAARHFLPPNALPYGAADGSSISAAAAQQQQQQQQQGKEEDDGSFGFPPAARPVHLDEHEWRDWRRVGDPVAHIELRRWADALVVAPLSANTLSKMASGACDNLLTCVARAWDVKAAHPVLLAPAMNTAMWESPFTARHLAELASVLGAAVVPPAPSKKLACGDVGAGAMAAPEEVARHVARALVRRGFRAEEVVRAAGEEAGG